MLCMSLGNHGWGSYIDEASVFSIGVQTRTPSSGRRKRSHTVGHKVGTIEDVSK